MQSFHDTLSRPIGVAVLLAAALGPLLGGAPAHAAAGSDRLLPGERFSPASRSPAAATR